VSGEPAGIAATLLDVVEDRAALVDAAVRRWSEQLIDVAGRNALLHFRDLKAGTLDLARADETAVSAVRAGRTVALARLFPDPAAHADAIKRARTIRNRARELHEERGIETCYLASGVATWIHPKGGAAPAAPVLLRSAVLRARGAAEDDFELTVAAEAEVNPVLVHVLATDFDVRFDADQLADLDPAQAFERLDKEAAERVRGFAIRPHEVIGTFSYAKLPMVTDLGAATAALAAHDVVAAIAGDRAAQAALRVPAQISDDAPDLLAPAAEFLVLDADSSQHRAINAVLAGQHAVIKGPPGTGKSQTIANLVTALVARGRRVLFVAEKRAAITAVTDRLTRRGLGQLVMDVHDGTSARTRLAAELKSVYAATARIALPDLTALHERLIDRRSRLAGYAAALHEPRQPWEVSVFQAQAALLSLPAPGPVRLRGPALAGLDAATTRQVRELMREYGLLGGFAAASSPWHGSAVRTGAQAQEAWLAAGRLAGASLATVSREIASVGLPPPATLADLRAARALIDGVAGTLARFDPAVFAAPLPELIAACADGRWRKARGVHIGWWRRRRLRRRAAALARGGGDLFNGLSAALAQRERWSASTGGPAVPAGWAAARAQHDAVEADVAVLAAVLPEVDLAGLALPELPGFAARLAADDRPLRRQPRRLQVAAALDEHGLTPLVAFLRGAPAADPVSAFDACWYASIVEHVSFADTRIGGFDAVTHERAVREFQAADSAHLDAAAQRVLRAVAEYVVAARDAHPDEDRLVEHQANLKRRHLPMRQLFHAAPNVLTALKPCWAMSPLVVSQLLPADRQYFDVVIFDEASQVTPADAVPAILRARQVVVAGDERQLPPTAFFTSTADTSDGVVGLTADGEIDLALTEGYESVLDVLTGLLPGYLLRWHYRSRDDRLIGFSNTWIYDGALVTFPGAGGVPRLTHVLVTDPGEHAEVTRVVELVLAHAAERPDESLGVIAMGITHAERIDLALRRALLARPELHGFFAESGAEPFFVKNLERVQGDERDAVILSIGYPKTPDGRLLYRFGPLLTSGGERRLNVAITRARGRMTVVSSFSAADMEPGRSGARGVALLREYLHYAADAGSGAQPAAAPTGHPSNPFERDVHDRLATAGVPVVARYGATGQHVEFAAAHPQRPAELLLAVETDGPGYLAAATVRDRDRLRPQQLERLGWHFHRIWSTDWFADPDAEVARAVAAHRAAVARADAEVAAPEPDAPSAPAADRPGTARGARPPVPAGLPITGYRRTELIALIRWIESDTLLRTEEEILEEVMRELGFSRRGPRIREAVTSALAAIRDPGRGSRTGTGDG
jgi:hypothetical protein